MLLSCLLLIINLSLCTCRAVIHCSGTTVYLLMQHDILPPTAPFYVCHMVLSLWGEIVV